MKNIKSILFLSMLAISSVGFAANVTTEKANDEVSIEKCELSNELNVEMESEATYEGVYTMTLGENEATKEAILEALGSKSRIIIVGTHEHAGKICEFINSDDFDKSVSLILNDDLNSDTTNQERNEIFASIIKHDILTHENKPFIANDFSKKGEIQKWEEIDLNEKFKSDFISTTPKEYFGKTGIKRCRK